MRVSLEGPPLTHCCLSRGQKGWLPGVSVSGQMRPVPRSVAAQCREGPKPVKDAPYSCAMAVTPPSITVHPSHHPHCLRGHWQPMPTEDVEADPTLVGLLPDAPATQRVWCQVSGAQVTVGRKSHHPQAQEEPCLPGHLCLCSIWGGGWEGGST